MVVTGGIDAAQARAIGERVFADWRATGAAPAVPTMRAGAVPTPRIVVIDMPGAGQAAVTAALRVPDLDDPCPGLLELQEMRTQLRLKPLVRKREPGGSAYAMYELRIFEQGGIVDQDRHSFTIVVYRGRGPAGVLLCGWVGAPCAARLPRWGRAAS